MRPAFQHGALAQHCKWMRGTPDRTVSAKPDEPCFFCLYLKFPGEIFAVKIKSNIHTGPAVFMGMPYVKTFTFINNIIEHFCLLLIGLFNLLKAAYLLCPLKHKGQ